MTERVPLGRRRPILGYDGGSFSSETRGRRKTVRKLRSLTESEKNYGPENGLYFAARLKETALNDVLTYIYIGDVTYGVGELFFVSTATT